MTFKQKSDLRLIGFEILKILLNLKVAKIENWIKFFFWFKMISSIFQLSDCRLPLPPTVGRARIPNRCAASLITYLYRRIRSLFTDSLFFSIFIDFLKIMIELFVCFFLRWMKQNSRLTCWCSWWRLTYSDVSILIRNVSEYFKSRNSDVNGDNKVINDKAIEHVHCAWQSITHSNFTADWGAGTSSSFQYV